MERCRTGKRQINELQVLQSNIETACYLGIKKETYRNGLDKREVENYNKTKFVFDLEYGRVIDFKGTKNFLCRSFFEKRQIYCLCTHFPRSRRGN